MPFEDTSGDSAPKVNDNWKSIGELARKLVQRHG